MGLDAEMKLFDSVKKKWEKIWLPRLQEGKTKVELERDKKYETNWVWYHTLLAIELQLLKLRKRNGNNSCRRFSKRNKEDG